MITRAKRPERRPNRNARKGVQKGGRLAGIRALVTGSSSGIGAGIAIRLAREGADVVINYRRNEKGAEQTLAEVKDAGGHGFIVHADLSRVKEIEYCISESFRKLGGLDLLVNNAGVQKQQPFTEVREEDYDQVLNINLKGVFFATQAFARALIGRGAGGKVINISSVHEELPFPGFASYCASKGGLKMLTRDLAIELAPKRIAVNAIAPGAIETSKNQKLMANKRKLRSLLRKIPLRRIGQPEDVAGAVVFLASSDADYVTGATLFVDGGLTWHYEEQ
jgi:glucose 1-dehydrogenase